ncbi:MAG: NAD-dependent epimerase/dehydratase family protein, partial [Acidobacteria bacterium]|nr:NAD-dependent epimerase/dehydratase family protein [Acidobacteriota bacterium]
MSRFSNCKGMRILIAGGAGMIGSAIAHLAVRNGAKVTILDAFLPMYGGNLFNLAEIRSSIDLVYGDIRDREVVRQAVLDQDLVFNMAAQVSYVDSNREPFFDLDVNCKGHLTVLEACRLHNRNATLIFPSSRFVYGEIESNPVSERHPYNCLSIYGVHKLNGEKYYQFYHRAHGMRTLIFRIANPFGPRQQMKHSKYGIVNWFIRMAMEGRPLTVFGDGLQKRDYVFVEDLAEAMLLAALKVDLPHGVFNLGSGVGTAFRDMVKAIAAEVPG